MRPEVRSPQDLAWGSSSADRSTKRLGTRWQREDVRCARVRHGTSAWSGAGIAGSFHVAKRARRGVGWFSYVSPRPGPGVIEALTAFKRFLLTRNAHFMRTRGQVPGESNSCTKRRSSSSRSTNTLLLPISHEETGPGPRGIELLPQAYVLPLHRTLIGSFS